MEDQTTLGSSTELHVEDLTTLGSSTELHVEDLIRDFPKHWSHSGLQDPEDKILVDLIVLRKVDIGLISFHNLKNEINQICRTG